MKLFQVALIACLLATSVWRSPDAFGQSGQSLGNPLVRSATLVWSPSPDKSVAGYCLYYGSSSGPITNRLDLRSALSVTISNLVVGTTYSFYATAYDAAHVESEPSNRITHTPGPPAAPSNLTAKVWGDNSVALKWQNGSTDVDGFHVERSLDGTTFARVATVNSSAKDWVITDTNSFSTRAYPFWFRIRAFNGSDLSGYSNLATAVTNLADLTIGSVSFSPSVPVAGSPLLFSAVLRNQGAAATPQGINVLVSFSVNGQPAVAWCSISNSLSPGSSTTVTAQQGPLGIATWIAAAGMNSITATVDTLGSLTEADETNNRFKMTIPVPLATAPVVSLSLDRAVVAESDSVGASVTIQRSGLAVAPLAVTMKLGGSARGGVDFAALPEIVLIPAGKNSVSFNLKPIPDRIVGPPKIVTLSLAPDLNYQFAQPNNSTLAITNQDVDTDRDGMSDAAERLAGTNEFDSRSNLKILSMSRAKTGQMTLIWVSVPGITYRVLSRGSLEAADWNPISPPIVATANIASWTFSPTNALGVYGLGLQSGSGL